jgi:hypothetical protein
MAQITTSARDSQPEKQDDPIFLQLPGIRMDLRPEKVKA